MKLFGERTNIGFSEYLTVIVSFISVLSCLKLIVIRNKKMIVNGIPREIYNNPKEKYIAALFDDVNEVVLKEESVLLYPHQIKIIDKPEDHTSLFEVEATVLNSYFKGHYWLIEADFGGQIVFFNHATDLKNDAEIKLSFEPYTASH